MAPMPRHPELSTAAAAMPASIFARLVERLAMHEGPIFPFHLGDTHLAPPVALDGIDWTAAGDLYRYSPPAGDPSLAEALAAKLARKNGIHAPPGAIQITAGATHAFSCAVRLVCDAHDEVLLLAPYWPLIRGQLLAVGARPVEVPFYSLLYEGADAAAILADYVTPRTAALYVTTPNNPDGKVLDARALEAVAALAEAAGLWILADEVYEDYTFDGRPHLSIAALPGMARRTLTGYSFSKSYGQAGLRVGYVVGPAGEIAALRRLGNHSIYSVPRAMQHAARAALAGGDAFLVAARASYAAARDTTVAALAAAGVRHHVAEGGSYLFVDLGAYGGGPSALPVLERLAAGGVLLAPGDAFGPSYARWARLCYTAVPPDRLQAGLARLCDLLGQG
jgi:aspartate/methionine/tyrosine aminotransferase